MTKSALGFIAPVTFLSLSSSHLLSFPSLQHKVIQSLSSVFTFSPTQVLFNVCFPLILSYTADVIQQLTLVCPTSHSYSALYSFYIIIVRLQPAVTQCVRGLTSDLWGRHHTTLKPCFVFYRHTSVFYCEKHISWEFEWGLLNYWVFIVVF